jgi:hypothetical protein
MLVGWATLLYGLWLLLPGDTFLIADPYQYLIALGVPEWCWGLLFAASGAVRLYASWRRIHTWRKWTALFGFVLWLAWWGLLLAGNPLSATQVVAFVFALDSFRAYLSSTRCHVENSRCNGLAESALIRLAAQAGKGRAGDG